MLKPDKIYLILFLLILFGIVIYTLPDYGITWDEPLYYRAGDSYLRWKLNFIEDLFSGHGTQWFKPEVIDTYWSKNAQHPPLVKYLAGVTHWITQVRVDPIIGYRISGAVWFIGLVALVFFTTYKISGSAAAWFASLAIATFPRLFADAHLVELDLPLAVMWLLTVYCFYRGTENWKWSVLTGIFFAFALSIKVTAIFLFIPLLLWAQFISQKKYTNNLSAMLFLGFPLFILCWPWLWHDTFSRIIDFYQFFFTFKSPLKTFYFGHAYSSTPWHYPIVLTLITTPIPVLALSLLGGIQGIKNQNNKQLSLLLLFNIAFFLILFALPGTLVIDGTRYFMPIFPILGIFSGIGVTSLLEKFKTKYLTILLFLISLLPSLFWIYYLHPCELSYYNLLVGGPKGAEKLGMEMTYWGEVLGPKEREWINQNFPPNARVKTLPVYPAQAPLAGLSFYPDVLVYYQERDYLRKDIQFFVDPPYDYIILISRQGLFDENGWRLYKTQTPVYSVKRGNLQFLGIYKIEYLKVITGIM